MIDTEEKVRTEDIVEPAKRWRNKWRALLTFRCSLTGEITRRGEIYPGLRIFPSRDSAETAAHEDTALEFAEYGAISSEYLGAFPE